MNIKQIITIFSFAFILSAFSCKTCKNKKKENLTTIDKNPNEFISVSKITSQYSYPGIQGAPPVNTYKIYLLVNKDNIVFDSAYINGFKTKLMVFNTKYQFTNNYKKGDSLILQAHFADAPEPLSPEEEINIEDFRELSTRKLQKNGFGYSMHITTNDKREELYLEDDKRVVLEPVFMP